jgi:hypothetical protein
MVSRASAEATCTARLYRYMTNESLMLSCFLSPLDHSASHERASKVLGRDHHAYAKAGPQEAGMPQDPMAASLATVPAESVRATPVSTPQYDSENLSASPSGTCMSQCQAQCRGGGGMTMTMSVGSFPPYSASRTAPSASSAPYTSPVNNASDPLTPGPGEVIVAPKQGELRMVSLARQMTAAKLEF